MSYNAVHGRWEEPDDGDDEVDPDLPRRVHARILLTVHACTGVPTRRWVRPVTGPPEHPTVWAFRCSCGDTCWATPGQLRRWNPGAEVPR